MFNLLKFESRKLIRQKSTYICLALLIGFILIGSLITKSLLDIVEDVNIPEANELLISAISSANLVLIIGIFIALTISQDYTEGTIKNIIAKGYSRNKIYLSKYIMIIIYSLIALIITYLTSIISTNMLFNINITFNNELILNIISQILIYLSYISFYFVIAILLKKAGASIASIIVGPMLITLVLNMIDSFLHLDTTTISSFWLDSLFNLSTQSITNESLIKITIMSIIYIITFNTIGIFLNKKQVI